MKTLFVMFALCVSFVVRIEAQTAGTFPLLSSVLLTNSSETLSAVTIQVAPSKLEKAGILLMPLFSAAGTGTSNVVFTFDLSPDGVTYSTTGPVTVTAACNGTNAVVHWANVFPDSLPNTQFIKLTSVSTTQTNKVTITAVRYYLISP
jgi:hypothetical protein